MKDENEPYALHLERQSKECTYSIVSRRVAHAEPKKKHTQTQDFTYFVCMKRRGWNTEQEQKNKKNNNKIQQHAYLRLHWAHLLSGACVMHSPWWRKENRKIKNENEYSKIKSEKNA